MNKETPKGWLMLLSYNEGSNWGSVDEFFDDIDSGSKNSNTIDVISEVWGKLHKKDMKLRPGDGIAFYHTTRARFNRSDPYLRRPRISLIGELIDIRQEGQYINWISLKVQRTELESIRGNPVIRNEKTEQLFRRCGMINGSVATFYEIPSEVWANFRTLAGLSEALVQWPKVEEIDDEISAFEGEQTRLFILHRKREAWLRSNKISEAITFSPDNRLCCEVPGCGFDFERVYGDTGHHFAEVHHLKPLADNLDKTSTKLGDLAIVCANCHRMIHRGGENRPMMGLIKES